MKKILILLICACSLTAQAQEEEVSVEEMEAYAAIVDSINNSFTYQTGRIDLSGGVAYIDVPKGFKYLDEEQSRTVLVDLWGNPPSVGVLGMLFPEKCDPIADDFTYAIEIGIDEEGFVEDEEAADLDYDDLLEEMQADIELGNEERIKQGYGSVELIGWASEPFYDSENKKLHWAKEIKFDDSEVNTLNYDIRILGRKGYLNLNAIADMDQLPLIKSEIEGLIHAVHFNEGHTYGEFNPDIDKIAAYGIGGLIAGKVLAKAGLFAVIAKFGKVIVVGVIALFAGLRKFIFGKKEEEVVIEEE